MNVPYTHYYATGSFVVGGRRTLLVRPAVSIPLRRAAPGEVGFVLRVSSAFGWQQVDSTAGSAYRFTFFTFVSGLRVNIPLGTRVLLQPIAEVGVGRVRDPDAWLGIGTLGAEVEFAFPWHRFEIGVEPAAGYSRTFAADPILDDGLFSAHLTTDVVHPLGFRMLGEQAELGGYVRLSGYWGDTDFAEDANVTVALGRQVEFGAVFGTNPRAKLWRFTLPPLRVGFVFGTQFRGIRIGFWRRQLRLPPR